MIRTGDYAVAAGASGAIFGIIGGLFWIVIRHKGNYEDLTWKGMIFMIALSLYYGIASGEVDNWGHIGGLLMGFLLCMILYRKQRKAVDFTDENPYTV
jgi:rhomboid protease GluP